MLKPNDDTIRAFLHQHMSYLDGQVHTALSGSLEHGTAKTSSCNLKK